MRSNALLYVMLRERTTLLKGVLGVYRSGMAEVESSRSEREGRDLKSRAKRLVETRKVRVTAGVRKRPKVTLSERLR